MLLKLLPFSFLITTYYQLYKFINAWIIFRIPIWSYNKIMEEWLWLVFTIFCVVLPFPCFLFISLSNDTQDRKNGGKFEYVPIFNEHPVPV